MSVRPFIGAERAEQAASSGHVSYSKSPGPPTTTPANTRSPRQVADEELASRIQAIYDQSRGTYGWPRVHQALRREGICTSGKLVARPMPSGA